MRSVLSIGEFSGFARELLRWLYDILGFGLGVACLVILVVGLLPENGMREQRSVAVWDPKSEAVPSRTVDSPETAFGTSRNSDSISGYVRGLE